MTRKILAGLAAFGLLSQHAAFAHQGAAAGPGNQVQITWDELAGIVVEKRIATVLPDGARLQGEVLAIRPESLVLNVQKSSRNKVYPRGQTEIPRLSVSEVTVIRERSAGMRIAGGILGALGGGFAVGALTYSAESLGVLVPGLLLVIPASAVAGYYAGKLADRYKTRLFIRPPDAVAVSFEEEYQ